MSNSKHKEKAKAESGQPGAPPVAPFVPAGWAGQEEEASQVEKASPVEEGSQVDELGDSAPFPADEQADQSVATGPEGEPAAAGSLGELAQRIEALLLASDEPLTPSRVGALTGASRKQIRESVEALNAVYQAGGHSFRIEQIADGLQMLTLGQFNSLLEQLLTVRKDSKLSQAALETLAVVAYKQPVTRADIEIVRGVACGEVLRTLMDKRLVKIVGRAEILGRPMLYGTTRRFLEIFGLRSIEDLPKAGVLTDPDQKDLGPAPAAEQPGEHAAESGTEGRGP